MFRLSLKYLTRSRSTGGAIKQTIYYMNHLLYDALEQIHMKVGEFKANMSNTAQTMSMLHEFLSIQDILVLNKRQVTLVSQFKWTAVVGAFLHGDGGPRLLG